MRSKKMNARFSEDNEEKITATVELERGLYIDVHHEDDGMKALISRDNKRGFDGFSTAATVLSVLPRSNCSRVYL